MKHGEYQNEIGSAENTTFNKSIADFEIVFWNGKERVPLQVEAIDGQDETIVLSDPRNMKYECEGGFIPEKHCPKHGGVHAEGEPLRIGPLDRDAAAEEDHEADLCAEAELVAIRAEEAAQEEDECWLCDSKTKLEVREIPGEGRHKVCEPCRNLPSLGVILSI
jgi:hypothetical protein